MTRASISEDVFRPWAVRANLLRKAQRQGGPKWHLYLWPEPGSAIPPEMVGPRARRPSTATTMMPRSPTT